MSYGDVSVLKDISLEVPDGEFLVLLGPSGCGKSTLLRIVAGLLNPSSGSLVLHSHDITRRDPFNRNMAFVFQSYALYPHLSVRENIGFPLAMEKRRHWMWVPLVNRLILKRLVKSGQISDRATQVAATLELTDFLDRKPKELSGGQRQRVALARSLIREPSLFLLDEPLSNLDAKLRQQMRVEISALHERVSRTFLYVTHDQVEAMTMATTIVVMNQGAVQQIGTPREIYDDPANVFVAKFVGSPPMNVVGTADLRGMAHGVFEEAAAERDLPVERLLMGVRPESISLHRDQVRADIVLAGTVFSAENLGAGWLYGVQVGNAEFFVSSDREVGALRGDHASLAFSRDALLWFDLESGGRA